MPECQYAIGMSNIQWPLLYYWAQVAAGKAIYLNWIWEFTACVCRCANLLVPFFVCLLVYAIVGIYMQGDASDRLFINSNFTS
jgi:hypothetical protein